jgi:hypothetical protein
VFGLSDWLRLFFARRSTPAATSFWIYPMTFKYTFTLPISGANKLPRFKGWAGEHAPGIEISLPLQVPVKSETLTIRLKSIEDRQTLTTKLAGVSL